MNLRTAAVGLIGVLLGAAHAYAAEPDGDGSCRDAANRRYENKAELPADVLVLMKRAGRMADAGEPFQVTDAVVDETLPFQRFMFAEQKGCALSLYYERGGRAYGYGHVTFRQAGAEWAIQPGSSYPYGTLRR